MRWGRKLRGGNYGRYNSCMEEEKGQHKRGCRPGRCCLSACVRDGGR
jgi:hypothetical protein